ncbi:response regulator transcription factor [Marinoscillum pacificum]|uniref:response regulator transcription factor n=1 Tax=Marinoscillum pacificum TaxID=392723 RepID=UPI002156FC16|nr:response regulator transcription factor [Marinoscillum pacificum]
MTVSIQQLRVVIADDHPMMLQGLETTLEKHGIKVLAAAKDGAAALQAIIDHQPHIAIIDIEMPYLSGFNIAKQCAEMSPKTQFVLLTYHKEPHLVQKAKDLNISGYLVKEDTSLEIIKCIEHLMNGQRYISKSISQGSLEDYSNRLDKMQLLSPSEKKILKMIAQPLSSQEIAEILHVSERTIEKHRSNIISKLGLTGQAYELSMWAREQKEAILRL